MVDADEWRDLYNINESHVEVFDLVAASCGIIYHVAFEISISFMTTESLVGFGIRIVRFLQFLGHLPSSKIVFKSTMTSRASGSQ